MHVCMVYVFDALIICVFVSVLSIWSDVVAGPATRSQDLLSVKGPVALSFCVFNTPRLDCVQSPRCAFPPSIHSSLNVINVVLLLV